MKKLFFAFVTTCFLISCGGSDKPETAAVKTSPEMDAFTKKLDGKSASVAAAVKEYGTEGLNDAGIIDYDLKEPVVTAANGACYTLDAKAGLTIRTYDICWENGKIKNIVSKGLR